MKRIFLITILSVLIIPTGISQDLPSYVPVDGLVAFYPFNGNANDASGNGYHGTRFQVGDGLDRHGNQNQSLYFNGKTADGTNNQQIINDSYVKVDNFDYSFSTSSRENQISISFWVKNEWNNQINPNDGLPILSRRTNNNIDFDLSLSGSNYNPSNAPALHLGFWSESSAQSVPDNSWTHCVVTCDGSNVKYYMQNQLYAEFSHNNGVISNNTSNLMIGKFSYQGALLHHFFFNGWIDDLGIWNKALTVEEISSLYNGSTSGGEILLNGVVSAEDNQIKNVADPTHSQDAVTLGLLLEKISSLQDQIDAMQAVINSGTVTDQDGNSYPYLTYGDQVWTVKNAEMVTYRDGTPIPQVTDATEWTNLSTGAWCYYDNDPSKGKLYNWYAVAGIHDNDENTPNKELAPEGWHVPSDAEWTELENYLIANGYNYDGSTTGNKIAKAMSSTTGWNDSTIDGAPGNNQLNNNNSGFNAFPTGTRTDYSSFIYEGEVIDFWSSVVNDTDAVHNRFLRNSDNFLNRDIDGGNKQYGICVRFVKD